MLFHLFQVKGIQIPPKDLSPKRETSLNDCKVNGGFSLQSYVLILWNENIECNQTPRKRLLRLIFAFNKKIFSSVKEFLQDHSLGKSQSKYKIIPLSCHCQKNLAGTGIFSEFLPIDKRKSENNSKRIWVYYEWSFQIYSVFKSRTNAQRNLNLYTHTENHIHTHLCQTRVRTTFVWISGCRMPISIARCPKIPVTFKILRLINTTEPGQSVDMFYGRICILCRCSNLRTYCEYSILLITHNGFTVAVV